MWVLELNIGPLQEQGLLTAEPSLQHHDLVLNYDLAIMTQMEDNFMQEAFPSFSGQSHESSCIFRVSNTQFLEVVIAMIHSEYQAE